MPVRRTARPRVRRGNEEDAEQLRQELLAAALALFTEGGLDAVTMRAVAGRVGVSTMCPYNYFADKMDLLRGIWLHVLEIAFARTQAASLHQPDVRARIRAAIGAFFDYWEEHPEHYRLVYMTEQTTRADSEGRLTATPVYTAIMEDSLDASRELARAIGGHIGNAKLASDLRLMMGMGYLHAVLVNRRYPWSDREVLRRAYIEHIIASMERCLLQPPA